MSKENQRTLKEIDREIDLEETKSALMFSALSLISVIGFFIVGFYLGY